MMMINKTNYKYGSAVHDDHPTVYRARARDPPRGRDEYQWVCGVEYTPYVKCHDSFITRYTIVE